MAELRFVGRRPISAQVLPDTRGQGGPKRRSGLRAAGERLRQVQLCLSACVAGGGAGAHSHGTAEERRENHMTRAISSDLRSMARRALALSDAQLLAECREEFFVASGPGGQHRNKTESGVRLAHDATGIVVTATERRSQSQNRAAALE